MDPEEHSDEVSDRNENKLFKTGEKAILQSPRTWLNHILMFWGRQILGVMKLVAEIAKQIVDLWPGFSLLFLVKCGR